MYRCRHAHFLSCIQEKEALEVILTKDLYQLCLITQVIFNYSIFIDCLFIELVRLFPCVLPMIQEIHLCIPDFSSKKEPDQTRKTNCFSVLLKYIPTDGVKTWRKLFL